MSTIFTVAGAIFLGVIALRIAYFLLRLVYLYLIPRNQRKRLRAYGEWAIVTGCTDGIGREYALLLAEHGMSVVLVSRSADKLHTVAEEIATKYSGVKTMTVVADFTRLDVYDNIKRAIADIDVGVLINNVGLADFNYENPKHGDKPLQSQIDTVVCNCVAQTAMSNIVLQKMAVNRRGLIVSLSSGSGIAPLPYMALYAATKRFNAHFGQSIALEYAEFGVESQVVAPFFIATSLSGIRRTNLFVKSARAFVRSHLNTFGVSNFVHGCIPHEIEALLVKAISSLPKSIGDFLVLRNMKKTARASVASKKRREQAAANKKQS